MHLPRRLLNSRLELFLPLLPKLIELQLELQQRPHEVHDRGVAEVPAELLS